MLLKALPRYSSHNDDITGLKPYKWPNELMNPEGLEVKYKGTTGSKQLNLAITSTAYNKLECHKTATKYSKARIVQTLILNYRFLTEAQRESKRIRDEKYRLISEGYREERTPPTPEEIQRCREEIDRIINRSEEAWDDIFDGLKEGYQERLSENDDDTNE